MRELKDWRFYACLFVALVLINLHPMVAAFVAGAGAASFYLHFVRAPDA